jgi:hypothetical protein
MHVILVLGCDRVENGMPVDRLKNRCDHAISVYFKIQWRNPIIIASGGQQSIAIKRYFEANGINSVIAETESMNTIENIINCNKILAERLSDDDMNINIHIITSRFHIERTKIIVNKYLTFGGKMIKYIKYHGCISDGDEIFKTNEEFIIKNIQSYFDMYSVGGSRYR